MPRLDCLDEATVASGLKRTGYNARRIVSAIERHSARCGVTLVVRRRAAG
jgi:hypothetical protein